MTDTTDGATGEAREGDVAETAAATAAQAQAPETTPAAETAPAAEAAGRRIETAGAPAADVPAEAPHRQRPPLRRRPPLRQHPQATGTVYEPGQAPQPYVAPARQYAAQQRRVAAAQAAAPTQPVTGQVPPAFGGPRPDETQPTVPVAGVPPYGTPPGQPAVAGQPAPKQRRVGLGVAAAIVAAALIGGASGAGITALITSNQTPALERAAPTARRTSS